MKFTTVVEAIDSGALDYLTEAISKNLSWMRHFEGPKNSSCALKIRRSGIIASSSPKTFRSSPPARRC